MAFVALNPATQPITAYGEGIVQFKVGPVKDLSGAAVDLSAWNAISFEAFFNNSALSAPLVVVSSLGGGAPTGDSSGNITGQIANTDVSALSIGGNATYVIRGKQTSGDFNQLLAQGTLSVR